MPNVSGQCDYEGDLVIPDQSTISIDLVVSGAESNSLGVNNCLKVVNTHFDHDYLTDLTIELISPSGQSVILVGYDGAATSAPSTDLVLSWDIQFFNEEEMEAIPDQDHEQIWDSNPLPFGWLAFNKFTGSYYPFSGSLDNFTGEVNGLWTLSITDDVQFADGDISCFGLEFCNTNGIVIKSCSTVSSTLMESDFSICEGDEDLILDLNPVLVESYDSTLYTYTYLIFEEDEYIVYSDIPDLSSFSAGEYTVCGLHYFSEDQDLIDNIPVDSTLIRTNEYLTLNAVCAELSDQCVEVTILSVPSLITESVTICDGESVIIGSEAFTTAGQYEIVTPSFPCDSVSILDLIVISANIVLTSSLDMLSCENDSISLNASGTLFVPGSTITWKTEDGRIVSNPLLTIVTIDKPGTYTFEIQTGSCVFSDDIVIGAEEDYSDIEIDFESITCLNDSILIDLSSSDMISNFTWTSIEDFRTVGEDILVGSEGIYSVVLQTVFGCTITRDINIEDVRELPNFELEGGTLTCEVPEITIKTTTPDNLNSDFQWILNGEELGVNTSQIVSEPGLYILEVTTGDGCIDSFFTTVDTEIDLFDVELTGGVLDCNNPEVLVSYTSSFSGLTANWTLPDLGIVTGSAFNTSLEGTYELELSNDKGCTLDTFLIITKDDEFPEVSIEDAIFECGEDSIRLVSISSTPNITYNWSSPSGFIDSVASPWVFESGQYNLEVCLENGCCENASVTVGLDINAPNIDFEFDNLNCNKDTTFIIPSDTSTYDMVWFLNEIEISVDSNIILVTDAGLYRVRVTNPDNGCVSTYSFNIKNDEVAELPNVFSNFLNCENDSVRIFVEIPQNFDTYTWSGPGLLDGSFQPFVDEPGLYFIDFTFANGCSGADTIEILTEGEIPMLAGEDVSLDCVTESVELNVTFQSSAINLTWDGPNNFFGTGTSVIATEPGVYNVYGLSTGLCRDTIQINVVGDTIPPAISLLKEGDITCNDSIVTIELNSNNVLSSFTFEGTGIIDQIGTSFDVDQPGIFKAYVVGDNGCESVDSILIELNIGFPEYQISLDSINCVSEEVTVGIISIDPALSIDWDGPQTIADDEYNFTTSQAGNYVFTIVNSGGCTVTDSLIIIRDTLSPNGGILLSNQINCDFDEATLSIENMDEDWDINWAGPGVTDQNALSVITDEIGIYQLELVGENGCVTMDEVEIVYDTTAAILTALGNPFTCLTGKVILGVESDLPIQSIDWTGPDNFTSIDLEPLVILSGVYTASVITTNGCVATSEIFIDDERVFPEIQVGNFYIPCDGAPAVITYDSLSTGAVPRWFGPNEFTASTDTIETIIPGTYVGVAISQEGCAVTDTFEVIDEPILPIFSATDELLLCFGPAELLAIEVDDDRSFVWKGPNGFTSADNPLFTDELGVYTLEVIGTNGCVDSLKVNINDGRIYPDAFASLDGTLQCENVATNLSSEGSSVGNQYGYEWTTEDGIISSGVNSPTAIIEGEGTFVLSILDENIGCVTFDTIVVVIDEQGLKDVVLDITPPTCVGYENGIIELTEIQGGVSPFQIIVDDNDYGERLDIPYLAAGEHHLLIIDSLGCEIDSIVLIDDNSLLSVDLPNDTTLVFGQTLNVLADINLSPDSIAHILWSSNVPCDGCASFEFLPNGNMTVSIEVIDINGCTSTEEFRITVNRPDNLPFPQIFSPDGDGVNDIFYLPMTTGIRGIDYIRVYDNWGGLMYDKVNIMPDDDSVGWDGRINGQDASMGVYIVEAVVTLEDDSKVTYVSDLTLIR